MTALTHEEIMSKALTNALGTLIMYDKVEHPVFGQVVCIAMNNHPLEHLITSSLAMYQALDGAKKLFESHVEAFESVELYALAGSITETVVQLQNLLKVAEIGYVEFAKLKQTPA